MKSALVANNFRILLDDAFSLWLFIEAIGMSSSVTEEPLSLEISIYISWHTY